MKMKSGCNDYIGVNMAKSEGISGDLTSPLERRYVPKIQTAPSFKGLLYFGQLSMQQIISNNPNNRSIINPIYQSLLGISLILKGFLLEVSYELSPHSLPQFH